MATTTRNRYVYVAGQFLKNSSNLRPIPLPAPIQIVEMCAGASYICLLDSLYSVQYSY